MGRTFSTLKRASDKRGLSSDWLVCVRSRVEDGAEGSSDGTGPEEGYTSGRVLSATLEFGVVRALDLERL